MALASMTGSDTQPRLGQRLAALAPSAIIEVGRKVRELRAAGRDIIHLGAGIPTPSPEFLTQPFQIRPEMNQLHDPAGDVALRTGISNRLREDYGLKYDPLTQIVVTVGAKQALYASLISLINPGDEVAILDPSWVTYGPSIELAGGIPKSFSLDRERGYALDVDALKAVCGPKTRVIVLNTPHNPTGRVFTRDELQPIADFALERGLWVISDESFDKFVFDGNQHLSIAALPSMQDRTIILKSFSKAYGFIGGRVGYVAAPAPVAVLLRRFNEHVVSCVSPMLQSIALALLDGDPAWTDTLRSAYQIKRDFVAAAVDAIPGMTCALPDGTFYIWADISPLEKSAAAFCDRLLTEAGVALTPGETFGSLGEGFVRFNLAGPMAPMEEGMRRVDAFVREHYA